MTVQNTVDARRMRRRPLVPARGAVMGSLTSALVGQLALVVTGVITTRTLGPTDRGYLALVVLVPSVLLMAGTVGVPRATTYFIANDPANESPVLRAIRLPAIAQAIGLTVLQAVILWILIADEPNRVRWAAVTMLPFLTGALADMYGKAILQGQARYAAFNVLRNASVTLYLVGVVAIFASGHAGLIEFAFAYVAASLLAGILTLGIALSGRHSAAPPKAEISRGDVMRFGLRGYFVSLSPIGTFQLDQALIGLLLPPRALGLYVAGLAFTNLPSLISRSIGMIAFPHVARATDTRAEDMRRFFWFSIASTGAAVVALEATAGWLVPFFFGSEFEDAVLLTRILLVGTFFGGARRVLTDTSSGSGRPGLGSVAELTSWVVVLPALAVLMPIWGLEGVAAAIAISSLASLLMLIYLLRRADARSRHGLLVAAAGAVEPVD